MINVNKNGAKITVPNYGKIEFIEPEVPTAETQERQWRDSELARTDRLILLPDFPQSVELLAYRQALRDYPSASDFPNGNRPNLNDE